MTKSNTPDVDIDQLARTSIFAAPEQRLLVGQLWQKHSVLLIFLRHFACIACRAHAAQVWSERQKFERAGLRLVFIGNGQPHWIERFKQELNIQQGLILTDPSLQSFKAAGFKNGFFNLVRPQSAINVLTLTKKGYTQSTYTPDAGSHFQMGGVLAVSSQGKVLYHYASKALGAFPDEPYLDIIQRDEKAA